MYLHENIEANSKTYIVPACKSSTRSNFCNLLGITFNKFPAIARVCNTGGVANATCSRDLNGSLWRFEKGLHLLSDLPGEQLEKTKSQLGEKKKPLRLCFKVKI